MHIVMSSDDWQHGKHDTAQVLHDVWASVRAALMQRYLCEIRTIATTKGTAKGLRQDI